MVSHAERPTRLVVGQERDKADVLAGPSLEWGSGQTEGFVDRLVVVN